MKKYEKKKHLLLNPTMQPEKGKKEKKPTSHNARYATCDMRCLIQFICFLRLGCMPAKASSSPAPAPASAVCSSPAPPLALDLVFLSFSLCICFVVRCRSSLSFTFFAVILDWRYSDFPPPPALFHISLELNKS